uniref:Uncharacterized protein n=1 Tax=Tetranychus urticae TaxID=32264 RepID=T1JTP6_TETUR
MLSYEHSQVYTNFIQAANLKETDGKGKNMNKPFSPFPFFRLLVELIVYELIFHFIFPYFSISKTIVNYV